MSAAVPTYEVALTTPAGEAVLEVPSFLGPDAAARRGYWTAVSLGWGEPDQITVTNTTLMTEAAEAGAR